MRNYSDDPGSVRVDFFKASGKWYTTEAVKMTAYFASKDSPGARPDDETAPLPDAFLQALVKHLSGPDGRIRLGGMWAVVIDPYHEFSHPQMVRIPKTL